MAEYTQNYNLKKPAEDDFYNVKDFNDNADIIDQALKAHDDALATKETPAGAQAKADAAEARAKAYTDQEVGEVAQALTTHLAESTQNAHLAKNIGIEDAARNFTATDVEGALNELFTSVSDGKTLIAAAITDKGGSASGSDTFSQLASAISGLGAIKSVQYGSILITEGNASATATISSVEPNKSLIMWLGDSGGAYNNAMQENKGRVELTNATTVTAYRSGVRNYYDLTVMFVVVEYFCVKSKQSGTITIPGSAAVATTITAVNPAKSILGYCGNTKATTLSQYHYGSAAVLLTNNTVTAYPSAQGNGDNVVGWNLIEFA